MACYLIEVLFFADYSQPFFHMEYTIKPELQTILPGTGLGPIRFGMSRTDVHELLGEPDEKEQYTFSESLDDMTESWHYDELELSASFDEEENWRLVSLAASSDDFTLNGVTLVGMGREELLSHLKDWDIQDLEFEDLSTLDTPDHKLITSPENGLDLWLDHGILSEVQWSVVFLDDDTVAWPKEATA